MGDSPDPLIPRMSPSQQAMPPQSRRFSDQFKSDAVRLVLDHGYTAAAAARAIGVSHAALGRWVRKAQDAAGDRHTPDAPGAQEPPDLAAENKRLRRELDRARMEVEILKKATAFFAKEQL